MEPNSVLLLIMYVFSIIAVLTSIYALWCVVDLQEEIKKMKTVKKLQSGAPAKKVRASWPPTR